MRRMMTNLVKKLHRQNGETLPEVLASILICTLSVAMLFTGVMASVRINEQAAQADKEFYETLNVAEQKTGEALTPAPGQPFQIMVNETAVTGGLPPKGMVMFNINYYGSDKLKSYKATGEPIKLGGVTP